MALSDSSTSSSSIYSGGPSPTLNLLSLSAQSSLLDILSSVSPSITSGDTFINNGNVIIAIYNSNTVPISAIFTPTNSVVNLGLGNNQLASIISRIVYPTDVILTGPFWPGNWNDENAFVHISYDPCPVSGIIVIPIQLSL